MSFFCEIISTTQEINIFINYDKYTMLLRSYVNDSACSGSFLYGVSTFTFLQYIPIDRLLCYSLI